MRIYVQGILGLLILIGGGALLQRRLQAHFSLNRQLELDIYFAGSPCQQIPEFQDDLSKSQHHFLLKSNCLKHPMFHNSTQKWPFQQILPLSIYEHNSNAGPYFEKWLQVSEINRTERIPPERILHMDTLEQPLASNQGEQLEVLHFLCAHPNLLVQHPLPQGRPNGRTEWETNRLFLLRPCAERNTSMFSRMLLSSFPENRETETVAGALTSLFEAADASQNTSEALKRLFEQVQSSEF